MATTNSRISLPRVQVEAGRVSQRELDMFTKALTEWCHQVDRLIDDVRDGIADEPDLAAHLADTIDAHDASAISFVPTGTIAATNVQTAIAEVASEAAIDLTNHLIDATDAHDASAISFTPTGLIIATDVQAALAELDTEKTPTTRTISTTAPLTGGGDLSANRTFAVSAATESAAGVSEFATNAETVTGADSTRATHPAGVKAALDVYAVPTTWTDASLTNGWSNFDSPGPTARNVQYRKIGDLVYLRGCMKNGTLNVPAFNLPAGFRPPYLAHAYPAVAGSAYGQVEIFANGNVNVALGSNTQVYLDLPPFSTT